MEDKIFDLTQTQIIPLLDELDEDTRALAIDMLTMSVYPIEHHPNSADIIGTLLQCADVEHTSTNPIIIAASTVQQIYTLAHGQHQLELIADALMMEYLEIVA